MKNLFPVEPGHLKNLNAAIDFDFEYSDGELIGVLIEWPSTARDPEGLHLIDYSHPKWATLMNWIADNTI